MDVNYDFNQQPDQQDIENGKTIAIISYITIIGWIVAYIMHSNNKTKYGAYHLRQSLGLFVFGFACGVLMAVMTFMLFFIAFLMPVFQIGVLILLILGIINAAGGKMQPLPIIGEFSNKLFAGIQ
ncbi:MAG: hypothetical protein Fur0041_21830 [Bacteroidia bacterium]